MVFAKTVIFFLFFYIILDKVFIILIFSAEILVVAAFVASWVLEIFYYSYLITTKVGYYTYLSVSGLTIILFFIAYPICICVSIVRVKRSSVDNRKKYVSEVIIVKIFFKFVKLVYFDRWSLWSKQFWSDCWFWFKKCCIKHLSQIPPIIWCTCVSVVWIQSFISAQIPKSVNMSAKQWGWSRIKFLSSQQRIEE